MHLFTNYIQPLTFWLFDHPNWALLITFLISFSESLAVVGSIIPGSVTMTAIGILAGSGVMRIDLTFLAATLGAIAGDSASYTLGYTFSDRLSYTWPFNRYPKWLSYGKEFFEKHGAVSVLVGRFLGPMRSIIPVVAGMMRMNHWHFFLSNTLSAVGWAFLYVFPGVLIGIASSDLSAESATRLFVLILILLIVIWLTSLGIKWILVSANQWLNVNLHHFWTWLTRRPYLGNFASWLTPQDEKNHYPTAALILSFISCFILTIVIIAMILQGSWITSINEPVFFFLESLRTQPFDEFFIVMGLVIGPLSLFALLLAITIYAFYYQDWRTLRYWISLGLTSSLTIYLLTRFIDISNPNGLLKNTSGPLFPIIDLAFATALFGFLIFYISSHYRTVITLTLRIILLTILFLAGLAPIYLGDNWITTVITSYLIGLTFCLLHWIFYRRLQPLQKRSQLPIVLSCLLLAVASSVSCLLYFKKLVHAHYPHPKQHVLTEQVWWNQQHPLLPVYSTNRVGQLTGLFNIQYVGSISALQKALQACGWKRKPSSFFYSLLIRAGGQNTAEELPLIAPIYLNRRPMLMMTYNPGNDQPLLILRLWRSNYRLSNQHEPIWLGSVQTVLQSKMDSQPQASSKPIFVYKPVIEALSGFSFHQINLPNKYVKSFTPPISPVLLIIKELDSNGTR